LKIEIKAPPNSGQSTHRDFNGKSDLPLDLKRSERRCSRQYLHLNVRHVRHGVNRQSLEAVYASTD
jgi:hypothetical protein